jgi:thiol-disulfide isomerase/thioredoxin
MSERPRTLRGARLIGLAAVAGLLAGLAAIYAGQGFRGNGNGETSADCAPALAAAGRAAPLARGEVAAFQVATAADDLSALSFKAPDGADTTLAALSGKTVLLNLWATWCVPCRKEMPALDRLEKALGGDRFTVVAVNIDTRDPDRARAFLGEVGATNLAFYSDPDLRIFADLKRRGLAFGLPTTVLVDGKGCRIGVVSGPAEWDSEDAQALIKAAMAAG